MTLEQFSQLLCMMLSIKDQFGNKPSSSLAVYSTLVKSSVTMLQSSRGKH